MSQSRLDLTFSGRLRRTPPRGMCWRFKKPALGQHTFLHSGNSVVGQFEKRRFTRLTNTFSKKIENHIHAVALFYMWYNFARVHQTLRVTPAMQAGISQHVWSIHEVISLCSVNKTCAA